MTRSAILLLRLNTLMITYLMALFSDHGLCLAKEAANQDCPLASAAAVEVLVRKLKSTLLCKKLRILSCCWQMGFFILQHQEEKISPIYGIPGVLYNLTHWPHKLECFIKKRSFGVSIYKEPVFLILANKQVLLSSHFGWVFGN
ncbi:uncharacterized protein LOC130709933 [Lotus japonicus]|uniref:uncharacterized protein LOC130709933 n=1 Tax=Lotus japonicus TaxID=34305 RepID=UPI00258D45A0|nr:uncharacterized protein LOC130709933 [Lotus japonicus]